MGEHRAPAYRVVNLGCKVNRVESDSFEAALERQGWREAPAGAASIVIVNTCTVTAEAEKKTRKAVRRALRDDPEAQVLVTGCSAAINPQEYEAMSPRIQVLPKAAVMESLRALAKDEEGSHKDASLQNSRVRRGVKVQDGCDNACTYCIVHVARGPSISRSADEVIHDCARLIEAGTPEIMLTGIDLGAYADGDLSLAGLLRRILHELPLRNEDGDLRARLRISSIEPQNATPELASVMASAADAVCQHLHLPLQSGSSKVLRQMARHYDADAYLETVRMLTDHLPRLSLTTDVIAGFPGEDEDDFQDTLRVAREVGFSKMHVFPYSVRGGTPAAVRTDQVPHRVKEARTSILRTLSDELRAADLARRSGSTEYAVVERTGIAMTESYHEVSISERSKVGTLVPFAFPPRMP